MKFKAEWFTLMWPKFPTFPQTNIPLLSRVHHQPLLPAVLVSFPLLLQYQPSFAQSLSISTDPSYKWKRNTVKIHNNHLDNCNHIQHSLAICNNLNKLLMLPMLLQWVYGMFSSHTSFKKITLPPISMCSHTNLHITENYCLLGCYAMHSGINLKMLWRNLLPPH